MFGVHIDDRPHFSKAKISNTIILYLLYIGFIIGDMLTIWNPEYKGTFYLFGIPNRDITLIIILIFFFLNQKMIFSLVSKKIIYFYLILLIYFTLQGIVLNGFSGWTRGDLRLHLWFLGGICFGAVLIRTGQIKKNLAIIVVLTSILIIASLLFGTEYQAVKETQISEYGRVSEMGIYVFSCLLYVPLILLFYVKNDVLKDNALILFAIGSILFTGVLMANARSMGIILIVIVSLYILSFSVSNNGDVIDKFNLKKYLLLITIICLIGTLLFMSLLSIDLRLERMLKLSPTELSEENRYLEAFMFYEQGINDGTLILGRGFGGTIISPISYWEETGVIHIGILNFWMKMGLVPFIIISFYVFLVVPFMFIKYLIKSNSYPSHIKTGNIIMISCIIPWIMSLAMSGGYEPFDSFPLGLAFLMRGDITKNGLVRIMK